MPQPMQNPEDSSDLTTAMNTTLALLAKAFKVNTIPTNNNQRSSLIPRNSQIAQSGMNMSQDIKMQMVDDNVGNQVRQNAVQNLGIQIVENMNGLSVVSEITNQYGNADVVIAPAEGNGNGINDAAYLQQQLQIAQEEEAGIQSTQEECEFMAADAYEETERVKVNCTSEDTLQQASTSGTQSDNAPVYDSDGSTEVPKDENCYDHDIFNMLTHEVQYTDLQTELDRTKEKLENCIIKKEKEYAVLWNNWYTKCEECKYDKISYDKAYNDMQQKIERLQAQLGDLKGKSSDTQCASNTLDPVSQKLEDENVSLEFQVRSYAKENEHLKTTYKNLFDSIKVTQAQTKSIIDSLQKQLYDTIYENAKLRAQLFDKVSEPKGTTKGTRTNTMFTKQSILGKPPSSSYKPKLYSVTPFPKSSVLPKVDKTNALSKPVTSNSAPSRRESKVVQTVNVIAPRIFRTNPSKTSRVDTVIPNKPVKTSVRIKPITVSQPNVIHKQQANSDSNGFSSTKVNNTAKTRRPHPRSNSNTDRVPSKSKITANHDVCVLNYVNDMNSRADNQSANVSIRENQKKHKANAKKSNKLGSTGSLASSRPSKPRTSLRWIPIGRIFAMYGKLTTSSNIENKSEKSMCDNASTSNPLKPSSKGFSNSASLLGRLSRLRKQHTSIYPINNVVVNSLTAELATYKEQVELYERRAKFELTEREQKINEQLRIVIVDRNRKEENLKRELHSVKLQLTSTINHNKSMVEEVMCLKKDFKQKENKYLEEFLDMKALKEMVEDKLYKQDQSLQTIHMLCKPKPYYDEQNKVAISYKNPLCLTRAKQVQPALYNGHEIIKTNHVPAIVHNSEDTLEIAEITRKKMNDKMKDPECVKKKVKIAPHDYSKENYLATFTPQKQLTPEQIFWSKDLIKMKAEALKEQTTASRPIKALTRYPPNTPTTLVPRVLPTKSQVKINIFALIQLFSEFEKTCKKRITPMGLTEGERGFEQTKESYLTYVIPFFKTLKEHFEGIQKALTKEIKEIFEELEAEVDQNVVNRKHDEIERKNLLIINDNLIVDCLSKDVVYIATNSEITVSRFNEMHDTHTAVQTRCLELKAELSKLRDKVQKDNHTELVKRFSNLEVRIYQKSQENSQKMGKHGHGKWKSTKEAKDSKPPVKLVKPWSTKVNSQKDKSQMFHFSPSKFQILDKWSLNL
ncbi:hypothetical protein Tco_1562459 [Tanacetum coccineum]